jgi:hypothetical protein
VLELSQCNEVDDGGDIAKDLKSSVDVDVDVDDSSLLYLLYAELSFASRDFCMI